MPVLHVNEPDSPRTVPFEPGVSIRAILDTTDTRVRSGCRGNGTCGLCVIQIEAGPVLEPTRAERAQLPPEQLDQGFHLACQVTPTQELWLHRVNVAPQSAWRSLAAGEYFQSGSDLDSLPPAEGTGRSGLGLAVDLGTTHISLALWDCATGTRLTGRIGLNQQARYGADVMTRLVAAVESPERARDLSSLAVDSIGQGIFDICSRGGHNPHHLTRVCIVGNTAELALLSQRNYGLLLQPRFWTEEVDCQPVTTQPWCDVWNIAPRAGVEVIAPLAGFVGSDLLAGVLATGMTRQSRVSLLIDFGTNTEIALWDGSQVWATSAAGGPALEGSGLSSGMPAAPGAIYHIEAFGAGLDFSCQVLPGRPAQGLCSSGIVDLIACLRRAGALNQKGKFLGACAGEGFTLQTEQREFVFTVRDADLFQRAKAAIGAGLQFVLRSAGLTVSNLEHVYVAGAFGRFLDVRNATEIGLLPELAPQQVTICGNTALGGCERLLRSPQQRLEVAAIRQHARILNMSNDPAFEDLFLENLYLRPLPRCTP
jgi:uncharacterized 2Fe-2S/4Fe-4S cluster protein (DUF4445 family)